MYINEWYHLQSWILMSYNEGFDKYKIIDDVGVGRLSTYYQ